MLCGQSHVVDSVRARAGDLESVEFFNMEQPRSEIGALRIKMLGRFFSQGASYSNALLERATLKAKSRWGTTPFSLLINYPQVIPPPSGSQKFSIFLHDANWKHYPGNFENPEKADRWCRGWIEKARAVVVNSEFTRTDVIKQYQCRPEKVIAAPLAPFPEKHNNNTIAQDRVILEGIGIEAAQFYLYPAAWGVHKGFDTLTSALEQAAETAPVVVTCGEPLASIQNSTREIAQLRQNLAPRWEKLKVEKKLIIQSGISDQQMGALRRSCKAYILPSQYEGFGFPLVEAICHHRPAIVSAIPAHDEILKRYPQYKLATMFDPKSGKALVQKLNNEPAEVSRAPEGWREGVNKTWSWTDTINRIRAALDGHNGKG